MRLIGIIFIFFIINFDNFVKTEESDDDSDYKIVCYYTNWAQYRTKPGQFYPENIDPKLCTHLIYAFGKIDDKSELAPFEWNDESTEWSKGMYERVIAHKKTNPKLKVLIAVGGWNQNSMPFSNMVSDEGKRKNFVSKAVEFLIKHKFDGLDLDWEYPANRDTEDRPDDKIYFTILCKDLRSAFEPHNFLLTAAVAAGYKYIQSAYELTEFYRYVDWINIMSYDMHGSWDNTTGHNAPLYSHEFDKDKLLNVDYAVKLWSTHVPSKKLVLGVASYGRSFKLREGFESCPLTDTPASEAASSGKFSREAGFLTYYEVCDKILSDDWKYVWNDEQKVPFAYTNEMLSSTAPIEWVGFDDVRSIEYKSKYIISKKLGGGMLWALDMDDFTGTFCRQGKYPILSVLNYYLNKNYKAKLPDETVLYKSNSSNKSSDQIKPIYEDSFFIKQKDADATSTEFLKSHNIFGLIKNDVLQIYKFCQCKNGTHKIISNSNENSFKVDCNMKKVYPLASTGGSDTKTEEGGHKKKSPQPKKTDKPNVDKTEETKSIWSIFGINTSSASNVQINNSLIMCMFLINIILLLIFS